jgi:uncharacterized RDD family membrane protein YckC
VGALPTNAYTSWIMRVGAAIIDYLPIAIVQAIAYGVAYGTGETSCTPSVYGYGGECVTTMTGFGVALLGLGWVLTVAYWLWNWGYRQGTTGFSIGKSVLKFKVVSEATGQPIGFGMSVLRQIAHFIDAVICYIGYLLPLFTAKRQTIADMLLSTVCLPAEPTP